MKLTLSYELVQMERMAELKRQPSINKTSRKLIEKKKDIMYGQGNDVHHRLYELNPSLKKHSIKDEEN